MIIMIGEFGEFNKFLDVKFGYFLVGLPVLECHKTAFKTKPFLSAKELHVET